MPAKPKKEMSNTSSYGMVCPWCGREDCKCNSGLHVVKGLVLFLIGILLWAGVFSLTTAFIILFMLMGLKLFILGYRMSSR